MTDAETSARQYDAMAAAYAADNADNSFNAQYERPAMISMLGEVTGLRVLEVGCGAGPLTAWLTDHGAVVTAIDISPEMVRLAQNVVGDRASFLVGDLAMPLSFSDAGTSI